MGVCESVVSECVLRVCVSMRMYVHVSVCVCFVCVFDFNLVGLLLWTGQPQKIISQIGIK